MIRSHDWFIEECNVCEVRTRLPCITLWMNLFLMYRMRWVTVVVSHHALASLYRHVPCIHFPLEESRMYLWGCNQHTITDTIRYATLRHATLQYTTLHYTTLHYTTLHYMTPHYTTLHYTTLHYNTPYYTTLHHTTLNHLFLYSLRRSSGLNAVPWTGP